VKSGEKFDTLVTKYSEDPGAKTNNGDIYYFTAGQMVAQFENAAYSMRKGEVSSVPTRSPFGYHIIKITDRKPVRGSIKVRHVMTRFQSTNPDSADTARAFERIKEMRDSLKKGWDFGKLAAKLSEDAGSSEQGGDLGWFERRQWVQQFDEAAFKLQANETSDIVRTPYGYHILKCDSVKPVPPFSAVREDLKKLYQQHRYSEDYKTAIEQIKKMVGYSFYDDTFALFLSHLDSVKGTEDKNWYLQVPARVRALPLFTIKNNNFSIDTILVILDRKADSRAATSGKKDMKNRIERLTESLLLETKAIDLEKRSPEFAALMKEYEDGIVLFKAEQLEVWNKTVVSDSALRAFYAQNQSKFMFPDRVNTSVIIVDSDTLAFMIYDSLKQGGNFPEFAVRYSDDPDLKSKNGVRELQPVDTDELTQQAALLSVNEFSEPIELEEGGYGIVKLLLKEPAREKSFEEAGAEVSNSYQEYQSKFLEKQWLEKIKQKHPVKQYKEVLQKAFSSRRVAH
ncbi:MAG TPA: peptidylprolyl isomerase, partial [Bacteroidota bacterium]|nr:peptidylprolyl isomerase [Bacteroidota bacterium]